MNKRPMCTAMMIILCAAIFQAGSVCAEEELKGTITVSGAWALYPMVVKWAEEFQKIYPKLKIDIAAGGAGKGMTDALAGMVDIGMVSRQIYPAEIEKGVWWVSVTKDAVVPTVNANNPLWKELSAKGITKGKLIGIWVSDTVKNWAQVIGAGETKGKVIHVYTRSDACGAAQVWAEFLGKKQEDLLGVGVYGDPGVTEAVKQDNLGIGYNNINYAYDTKTKRPIDGIAVLPIDTNENQKIDKEEDFYQTRDALVAAIETGAYPSPPARELYLVSKGKPTRKEVIVFLRWVLSDGQAYVAESGYINLTDAKLQNELNKLGAE